MLQLTVNQFPLGKRRRFNSCYFHHFCCRRANWLSRRTVYASYAGSSPVGSATFVNALVAQLDRAFGFYPTGWGFDFLPRHHFCTCTRSLVFRSRLLSGLTWFQIPPRAPFFFCLEGVDRYTLLFQSRLDGALPSQGTIFLSSRILASTLDC